MTDGSDVLPMLAVMVLGPVISLCYMFSLSSLYAPDHAYIET
jgi:hypothetical protein